MIIILLVVHLVTGKVHTDHIARNLNCFLPPVDLYINNNVVDENVPGLNGTFGGCHCEEHGGEYVKCFGRESCKQFPKSLTSTATFSTLKLHDTGLEMLQIGDFENVTDLEQLLIEGNHVLREIEAGVFSNMSVLRKLSISHNEKLNSLQEGVFEGLIELEVLTLAKNGFEQVNDFSVALNSQFLPNLSVLSLREMQIQDITETNFVKLSNSTLKEFEFVDSQLMHVEPNFIEPFSSLVILRLDHSTLNETSLVGIVRKCVELGIHLKKFSVRGFDFEGENSAQIFEVLENSTVIDVDFSQSIFHSDNVTNTPVMTHVESLVLNRVSLQETDIVCLFPALKRLELNRNRISTIPDTCLPKNLTHLDLSWNSGDSNSKFMLGTKKFTDLTELCTLNLSFNNIGAIHLEAFDGLSSLVVLILQSSNISHLDEGVFKPLTELLHLNMEGNNFSALHLANDHFLGLNKLETLILRNCSIVSFSESDVFEHLKLLKRLDISSNSINVLDPNLMRFLSKLTSLNVGFNELRVWNHRVFQNNPDLEYFNAVGNHITHLSGAMLEDVKDVAFTNFSGNPMTCRCTQYFRAERFLKETNSNATLVLNTTSLACHYAFNLNVTDYFSYIKEEFRCTLIDQYHLYIIFGVCCIAVVLVFLTIYLSCWRIRYWIFLLKLTFIKMGCFQKRSALQRRTSYRYDALVSYGNEDRNFVVRLVAMLENYEPFLKLCVPERDYEVQPVLSENVLENVGKSRRVLFIVSSSYARTQWDRWETLLTGYYRLFFKNEGRDCVIVKLGNISREGLSPMLKYLMKNGVYLQWDPEEKKQKIFWELLRNSLRQN